MKRLKTGMKVHIDAGKGRLTIVRERGEEEGEGPRDQERSEKEQSQEQTVKEDN